MTNSNKVIAKGNSTLSQNKKVSRQRRKRLANRDSKNRILEMFKTNWKKLIIIAIPVFLLVTILSIAVMSGNPKVLTINKQAIREKEFNIYLYSAKYNYFGENTSNVTDDDLNVIYDSDTNMTVGEYLKSVALNDIKTSIAIKLMAENNNIKLKSEDYDAIKKDKQEFIKTVGGSSEFKKLLKENNTDDGAYDKMSETDALYQKIIKELYSEGSVNDLTEKEIESAKESYKSEYYKLKQVILTTIDVSTGKSLSKTAINQKETLAKSIVAEAKKGTDFDSLIKKYSEDATEKEPPYDVYYRRGKLLSDLESAVKELEPGSISQPVKTKYAYHIIMREELDDAKLSEYLDSLREDKCVKALKELIDEEKVVYHETYKKIKL